MGRGFSTLACTFQVCKTDTGERRFISCKVCTTLVGDVDNRGGYTCVGAKRMWEISVPSVQFYCESETALKNSVFFFFFKQTQISENPSGSELL